MIRRFRRIAAAVSLAIPAAGIAQQAPATTQGGTIAGTVRDRATQQPITSAQVQVVGTTRGGLTGDQGTYRITGVPAGAYQVRVLRIGYQATVMPVTVTSGQSTTLDMTLGASAVTLEQVTVTATGEQIASARPAPGRDHHARPSKSSRRRATSPTCSTRARRASTSSSPTAPPARGRASASAARTRCRSRTSRCSSSTACASNNDVGNREQANVSSANTLGTNIGTGGQTVSRLNDINPEDIETIEIIKGPAGVALYGTAAANGVIQITTKRGRAGTTRWQRARRGRADHDETSSRTTSRCAVANAAGATVQCNIDTRTRGLCTADEMVSFNPLTDLSPFRTGNRRAMGLNASGGTERFSFFLCGDYDGEAGVLRDEQRPQGCAARQPADAAAQQLGSRVQQQLRSRQHPAPHQRQQYARLSRRGSAGAAAAVRHAERRLVQPLRPRADLQSRRGRARESLQQLAQHEPAGDCRGSASPPSPGSTTSTRSRSRSCRRTACSSPTTRRGASTRTRGRSTTGRRRRPRRRRSRRSRTFAPPRSSAGSTRRRPSRARARAARC